jgi:hypothetical protein
MSSGENDVTYTRAQNVLSHLMLNCQLQNLFEGIYGILATDRVALKVPNVVVCGEEDLNDVLLH